MPTTPERCPNNRCRHSPRRRVPTDPPFFRRKGAFRRSSGDEFVARFQCKSCGKHFSEQTFRNDYRERLPELEATLRLMQASGFSRRRAAKLLGVHRKTVAKRYRRFLLELPDAIGRTC
jgi:transposase-like protein